MKTSLIVFGVIFLVLGGLLYFVPLQQIRADTTTAADGTVDTRTSTAGVTVPVGWAYASSIIGFVLLMFGLVAPGHVKTVQGPRGPRGRSSVRHSRRSTKRRARGAALPRGTSVTTTTRIRR